MQDEKSRGFTFKVVFSGLCAYVPNRIVGSGGSASSWSVLLPNLNQGKTVGDATQGIRTLIQTHWAVLRFRTDHFEAVHPRPNREATDLTFRRRRGHEFGLFQLRGERVRFGFPPGDFRPNLRPVDDQAITDNLPDPEDRKSLQWAPEIETLLPNPGAGTMGSGGLPLFQPGGPGMGFPAGGNLSAHVLLERGTLESSALFPPRPQPAGDPINTWEFRRPDSNPVRQQPLAYTVDLVIRDRPEDPAVTLMRSGSVSRTLRLRPDAPDEVELQIMLREPEEVFDQDGGTPDPDRERDDDDFHIHYAHSGRETDAAVAIPHLVRTQGVGGSRRTCGSARFLGFDPGLAQVVGSW